METQSFLQFYADKENKYSNKLFSFKVDNLIKAFNLLFYFHKNGNKFRSMYIKRVIDTEDRESDKFIKLPDHLKFFANYDFSHNPTNSEAYHDFLIELKNY